MEKYVEINGLYMSYGKKEVFSDFNLEIEPGKIVGLLGPNGSGKTTLIKLLAGLLSCQRGEIKINGNPIGVKTKEIVSYLPDRLYFKEGDKVSDLIKLFRDFYSDFDAERSEKMLKALNIDRDAVIRKLSKGTKEKIQLILVMSRKAGLYLLDEPVAGVDPAAREFIIRTIITNYEKDASVLLATHLIQDVENILDDVIFIKNGQIVRHKAADDLRAEMKLSIDEIFREDFKC